MAIKGYGLTYLVGPHGGMIGNDLVLGKLPSPILVDGDRWNAQSAIHRHDQWRQDLMELFFGRIVEKPDPDRKCDVGVGGCDRQRVTIDRIVGSDHDLTDVEVAARRAMCPISLVAH